MTAGALTRCGYYKKDAYAMLDRALEGKDLSCALGLAAELAATHNEAAALVSHLLGAFATWYVGGCVCVATRVGALFDALGGSPAVMNTLAQNADRRRALSSLIVTLCALPRRAEPMGAGGLLRGAPAAARGGRRDDDIGGEEAADALAALARHLTRRGGEDHGGATRDARTDACVQRAMRAGGGGGGGERAVDPAWRVWGVLEAHAATHAASRPDLCTYVRLAMRLYGGGLQAQRYRDSRAGVLMYAARVCARGRVSRPLLSDAALAAMDRADVEARARVDEAFAPPDDAPAVPEEEATAPTTRSRRQAAAGGVTGGGSGSPQGAARGWASVYMRNAPTYNTALRVQMAEERGYAGASRAQQQSAAPRPGGAEVKCVVISGMSGEGLGESAAGGTWSVAKQPHARASA